MHPAVLRAKSLVKAVSTDFPDPEGTKGPLGYFEQTMDGVFEPERERFYSKTFAEMRWGT